jgi:hypothetical protein
MRFWATALTLPVMALAAIALTAPAAEASLVFDATLSGGGENPPNASTATGTATLTLTGNTLNVDITFSGLAGMSFFQSIHCCSAPGSNSGIAVFFPGFPTTISGTYVQNLDLTNPSIYFPGFVTTSGGTVASAEAALIAGLDAGDTYVNIPDVLFPGGEIRGFDTPVTSSSSVPEPASLALFGAALASLALLRRRRKAA